MNLLIKVTIVLSLILNVISCTPSAPYEIKSPCVSIESDHPYAITPCVRRPANLEYAII